MPAIEIDLDIDIPFAVGTTELNEWKTAFNRTSEIIFHATNQQMKLGYLNVYVNAVPAIAADVLIDEVEVGPSTSLPGHIHLYREERNFPSVIVHEFGHFQFNLGEEYPIGWKLGHITIQTHGSCTDQPENHSCIMQFSENANVTEFCHSIVNQPGEHKTGSPANQQHQMHSHHPHEPSCWGTIIYRHPTFIVPDAKRVIGVEPDLSTHTEIGWNVTQGGAGFVVLLESTLQFDGTQIGPAQTAGIGFWIDYLRLEKQRFGLVNSSGEVLFDLQTLETDDQANQAHAILENLAFTGSTDVNKSLVVLSVQFEKALKLQTKRVVWISADDVVKPPSGESGRRFRRYGIRVDSVGIGDREPFFELAASTRGSIAFIDGDSNTVDLRFRVQNELIESCLDSQPGYYLVSSALNQVPMWRIDKEHPGPTTLDGKDQELLQKVLIEPGVRDVKFVISVNVPCGLKMELIDPDGKKYVDDGDQAKLLAKKHYQLLGVQNPKPGIWSIYVSGLNGLDVASVKSYCYCNNPDLLVKLTYWQTAPLQVDLYASVFMDGRLAKIEPVVVSVIPPGVPFDSNLAKRTLLEPIAYFDNSIGAVIEPNSQLYQGQVKVEHPGIYTIVARFVNAGSATIETNLETKRRIIAPFVRTIAQQIRITGYSVNKSVLD